MGLVRSLQEAKERYGEIVHGAWDDESKWCSAIKVPWVISRRWINAATGNPVRNIYCNKDMQGPLGVALNNLIDRGGVEELMTYDGCFSIRDVRGRSGHLSAHAYALAIDLNAKENPLGGICKLSEKFIKCWTDAGFDAGAVFTRPDPMHFSYFTETTFERPQSWY